MGIESEPGEKTSMRGEEQSYEGVRVKPKGRVLEKMTQAKRRIEYRIVDELN